MRYEQYTGNDISYAYKVNTLTDVMDLSRFKPARVKGGKRSFKKFRDLLGLQERKSTILAKQIFNDFLVLVAKDMINENEIYVFPEREFGCMRIANIASPNSPDYIFNIETDGKIFGPRIILNKRMIKKNKLHFRVNFNKELQTSLEEKLSSGHKYAS